MSVDDLNQLRIKIFIYNFRIEYFIESYNNKHKCKHKCNGPAMVYDSSDKYWIINDEFYRTDGPAIIWSDGDRRWRFD